MTRWGREKFINTLLYLQAAAANNMLGLLLREDQILRLNFESDVAIAMDDVGLFHDLISRADKDFTYSAGKIKAFLSTA
ncbi:MAG TPA: hypothetical protein DCP92_08125 [Nitrospiraceae bacterium]|jgi:hypothetical protein|nr:hypothetical protein [Nitrospiraceae bacterium]